MNPAVVVLGILLLVIGVVAVMLPAEAANAIKIENFKDRPSQILGGGLLVIASLLILAMALKKGG